MTEATRREPGTPCWVSLMVHGLDATQRFYGELFGWEFRPGPRQLGPYVRALLDGLEVAGLGRLPADRHLPVSWTTYLATRDARDAAESIRCAGGTVAVGPIDAGEAGRIVICSDPSGAVFGVWQAAAHLGTAVRGVPGAPVWNELLTHDTESVAKFYRTVFGCELDPLVPADTDLVTLRAGGQPVAGLRGMGSALPRDRGAHWMTWFEVADPDAAARRVEELGGRVLRPPGDAPEGRHAVVADPEGAVFTIVRSAGV
ncbi:MULTISPECIES: VOC family protein [Streptomyces]|uniref:Bleomycin resistance protein n=2 Tax=Streptomyces TaxID=1883 RepID=A0A100Y3B0_9ACTN|nr:MULTISPECIES: VOC family protein [Streptomyces]KUH36897.1 bleomycin resistance protein [Streptomyces kanasensis]UUS33330.1 VOC family protein [Streptomyces changanensis]